jgi:hypothetical protein
MGTTYYIPITTEKNQQDEKISISKQFHKTYFKVKNLFFSRLQSIQEDGGLQ